MGQGEEGRVKQVVIVFRREIWGQAKNRRLTTFLTVWQHAMRMSTGKEQFCPSVATSVNRPRGKRPFAQRWHNSAELIKEALLALVMTACLGANAATLKPESYYFHLSASSNYLDFSEWFWPGQDFSTNFTFACTSQVDEVNQEVTLTWGVTRLQSLTNQYQFLLIATQDEWSQNPYPTSGLAVAVDTNSVALVDIKAPAGQRIYYQLVLDSNAYQRSCELVGTGDWQSYIIPFSAFGSWAGHPLDSFTSFSFRVVLADWQLDRSPGHTDGTILLRNIGVGNWLSLVSFSLDGATARLTGRWLSTGNSYEVQSNNDLIAGTWTGISSFVATNREHALALSITNKSNQAFFRLKAK